MEAGGWWPHAVQQLSAWQNHDLRDAIASCEYNQVASKVPGERSCASCMWSGDRTGSAVDSVAQEDLHDPVAAITGWAAKCYDEEGVICILKCAIILVAEWYHKLYLFLLF